ncbi:Alpha-D-GlcNAc alpha-1,2-L-rhamnosyltransferase [Pseudonocardia sp. Ae505_Ps2]|nr:Alpha-D-GlcNAc alpha-1,2-L-rhamnosyltransferase [Pseudonocardia sp. Ae505_Ps2]
MVGSVPYPSSHERHVRDLAGSDPRVRLLGSLWDQELLNSLYAGAASYLHGHSVGGTNPSLLRAMGAGAPVVAWDIEFNREVLAETGRWFASPDSLAREVEAVEADPVAAARRGADARRRARTVYDWDDVAEGYAQLCADLYAGRRSRRGRRAGGAPAGVRR